MPERRSFATLFSVAICVAVGVLASGASAVAAKATKGAAHAAKITDTAGQLPNTGERFAGWFGSGWDANYQYSAALILAMFFLGLVFFLVISFIVWRAGEGLSDRYMRVTLLLVIIFVALAISVSGFEEKTTNAMLGLVGTIAGYLLGRVDRPTTKPPAQREPEQPGANAVAEDAA